MSAVQKRINSKRSYNKLVIPVPYSKSLRQSSNNRNDFEYTIEKRNYDNIIHTSSQAVDFENEDDPPEEHEQQG